MPLLLPRALAMPWRLVSGAAKAGDIFSLGAAAAGGARAAAPALPIILWAGPPIKPVGADG